MKSKHLIVFGTRPEAIKMSPLVKALINENNFETKVCVTAQHRGMLDQVLSFFDINPDFDLNIMKTNQNLHELTSSIITKMKVVLDDFKPDFVYVHGDTTTTMATALSAFYNGISICHIEAGLRTWNKLSPFPEEINRQITTKLADYHFAPTQMSKNNLLKENISKNKILVTGNTVIDALLQSNKIVKSLKNDSIENLKKIINFNKKIILVTSHRRENHGTGFANICVALKSIAKNNSNCQIIYPVHLNPKVKKPVYQELSNIPNINLIDPLSYPAFVWLMNESHIILTDSGGIQEEAPSLGKPVLVMRENTERPEAVEVGTVILVGTKVNKIINKTEMLLNNKETYNKMSELYNPYGDGKSTEKIINFIKQLK